MEMLVASQVCWMDVNQSKELKYLFAMTPDCSQVMYHAKGEWSPYEPPKNIRWTLNTNVRRKSE